MTCYVYVYVYAKKKNVFTRPWLSSSLQRRRYNPEDSHHHLDLRENLRSYGIFTF
jgi:hypothetical protein